MCIKIIALKLLLLTRENADLCTNYVKTKKCAEEKDKKNEELKVVDV
jgi:hypothetical protein